MKLPVDVKEVLQAMEGAKAARDLPAAVLLLVDESAPTDLIEALFGMLEPQAPRARRALAFFGDVLAFEKGRARIDHARLSELAAGCDAAVLAVGDSPRAGALFAALRVLGLPVLAATSAPERASRIAEQAGFPLPEADLAACNPLVDAIPELAEGPFCQEPYPLTLDRIETLAARMGEWFASVFPEKRLAFAAAFPFVRRTLAFELVAKASAQNAGIGAVAFIPGSDLPLMTLNQIRLAFDIAALYGIDFGARTAAGAAGIVGSAFLWRSLARQLAGAVPFLGWAAKAAIGYSATTAIGVALIAASESEALGLGPADEARLLAVLRLHSFEMSARRHGGAGRAAASALRTASWRVVREVSAATAAAAPVASAAVEVAGDLLRAEPDHPVLRTAQGALDALGDAAASLLERSEKEVSRD